MFQYDESTNKPVLDENGELIPRKEYFIDGINCDPFTFDLECRELNALYHKNKSYDEIKSHHYIISFDPKDAAEKKITDREYHAGRRGQKKLDECNRQVLADGLIPRKTEFQTQKEFLRSAIEDTASLSCSQEDFQRLLLEKYNIKLKVSRGRFSYLHPKRSKYITGRMLGTHYEEDYLLELFKENAERKENKKETAAAEKYNTKSENSIIQPSSLLQEEALSILFVKSDLRLVVNLQDCVKAQQSAAYANKIKLSNLKEMARTVAYIQEHGYDTKETLENSFLDIKKQASGSKKGLKSVEDKLRGINEQIHYTGQYLANKSVYQQFCKSKSKGQFRKEHSAEIALYETARKFLKEHSADNRLPSMKLLKAEKERLRQKKKEAQDKYHYYRDYQKELHTVCSNVDMILGQTQSKQPEKQKSTDIS